jgi:tetratricopeptide (TPR) repeat protein
LLRGDVGALAGAALHLVKRAAAQRAAGDAAAAGETLERAVEIDPTCGFAYYDLAELHLEQGRAEQALAFADKALVVGGSYGSEWLSHAQLLLGRALQASGRTGEAADAYRRALALDAGNLPARIALRALP